MALFCFYPCFLLLSAVFVMMSAPFVSPVML
nr:MAG TPA: hypothetical protein [Caudoviricetes sp.]